MVFTNLACKIYVAAIKAHIATPEAAERKASKDPSNPRYRHTEKELLDRFLLNVAVTDDGSVGTLTANYSYCEIGQALFDAGYIKGSRVWPVAVATRNAAW